MKNFYNIIKVFIVTFDQFNVFLLNEKNLTDLKIFEQKYIIIAKLLLFFYCYSIMII